MELMRQAVAQGFYDAAFLDRRGRLSEGTIRNLVLWDRDVLAWPVAESLDGTGIGILRRQLDRVGVPSARAPMALAWSLRDKVVVAGELGLAAVRHRAVQKASAMKLMLRRVLDPAGLCAPRFQRGDAGARQRLLAHQRLCQNCLVRQCRVGCKPAACARQLAHLGDLLASHGLGPGDLPV